MKDTKKRRPTTLRAMRSMGGEARAAKLSPEERSQIARDAALARWAEEGQSRKRSPKRQQRMDETTERNIKPALYAAVHLLRYSGLSLDKVLTLTLDAYFTSVTNSIVARLERP